MKPTNHNGRRRSGTKSRGPGRRPQHDGDSNHIRESLLVAARHTFARQGFRGTTLRQVAEAAGVSAAMIHYHFTNKHGLYLAMLEETVGPMLKRLQTIADSGDSSSLEDALRNYIALIAATPDLPALLMRDVLATDGVMRDAFVRDFAARGAGAMGRILQRDREAGRLRADIDPRFALLSLISMAVFPFIARPIAEKVLELDYDDSMAERLAAHTARLFYEGANREHTQ